VAAVPVQAPSSAVRRACIDPTDVSISPAMAVMSLEAAWMRSVSTVNGMACSFVRCLGGPPVSQP